MDKKKKRKKTALKTLIVIGAVLLEVIIFFVVFNFVTKGNESVPAVNTLAESPTSASETTVATKASEKPTEKETDAIKPESNTESQTESQAETQPQSQAAPEKMVSALQSAGYSVDDLAAKQLVVVNSQGSSATISMYSCDDNGKWSDLGLTTYGYVGSNGVDIKSLEGDYKTPYGLFSIGDMFYIDNMPQTALSSFQITSDTYWVDDPNSAYYNQRVEGTENMDWTSAEHMISYYSSYKYGFVINYNMNPVIPGKGSAIFFHVGSEPTAGCVAVSEYDMLSYLSVLNAAKNPYILII
ncbi:MAG: L,D-transpeptidase [Acutalibacteraceae bacterium]